MNRDELSPEAVLACGVVPCVRCRGLDCGVGYGRVLKGVLNPCEPKVVEKLLT